MSPKGKGGKPEVTLSTSEMAKKIRGWGGTRTTGTSTCFCCEQRILDTSFSALEMLKMIALCLEHRPVRWEVTAPVMSCLFSCPSPGAGGCRGHFVFTGSGGLYFTQYIEYKGKGWLPSLVWGGVRFVITSHHSVLRTCVMQCGFCWGARKL